MPLSNSSKRHRRAALAMVRAVFPYASQASRVASMSAPGAPLVGSRRNWGGR
jgi:hypothetical protein